MTNNNIADLQNMDLGKMLIDEDLSKYTTYKVGGKAKVLVFPENKEKLIELLKYIKENKSTGFKESKILENKKCKLSFETISNNSEDDIKSNVMQITKLFIAPDITITPGSKIEVTNAFGEVTVYKSSGEPAKYQTHQEIVLELVERYA